LNDIHKQFWRRESRRTGIALIGGTGVVTWGWIEATHAVFSKGDRISTHPVILNRMAFLLLAGFLLGLYLYVGSFYSWTWFGRNEADKRDCLLADEEVEDSLFFDGLQVVVLVDKEEGPKGINISLAFGNGREKVIDYEIVNMSVSVGGLTTPLDAFRTRGGRILPGRSTLFHYPMIPGDFSSPTLTGEIDYALAYGARKELKFKRHHKLTFLASGTYLRWDDLAIDL
jgi:hypothetical protein